MMKHFYHHYMTLTAVLGVSLCAATHGLAQGRFGGFGGGGFGGGNAATRSSSSGGATARQYPNNTQIGDAYFTIDPETRRIIYIADERTAQAIAQVLTNLDRPKPQVFIKAVFVELTRANASDIGLEGGWGKQINNDPTKASAVQGFGLSGLSSSSLGTNLNSFGQPVGSFSAVSPMTQPGAGLFQLVGQDYQVTLRAIAQANNAKVLSRPSILARNNQPATIQVGQNVPLITSTSYNGLNGTPISSYRYQSVGVILTVTPFITMDRKIEMIVSPQISSIDQTTSIPVGGGVSAPVIDIRSADTVAVTADGETIIIGGLMQDSKAQADTKIPFLGDIPLLGNLFKRSQKSNTQTELLIFLTPHIVGDTTELASLSTTERTKSGFEKKLTDTELDRFFDSLQTNAPAGSKSKRK